MMIRVLSLALLPTVAVAAFGLSSSASGPPDRFDRVVWRPAPSQALPPAPKLRVMTLNAAHGRRLASHQFLLDQATFRRNLQEIGTVLAREAPDVVALQEVDGPSAWSGNFNHVDSLSRIAGFPHTARGQHGTGVGPIDLDYGTGILSRLPLNNSRSQVFDQSWRDNKGFVRTTIEVPGWGNRKVDIVSVHLDFLRAKIRAKQVAFLVEELSPRRRPLILLGDMNCGWEEPGCLQQLVAKLGLRTLVESSPEPTFPADKPRSRIDWVLVSEELEISQQFVLPDVISDHRAVVAEISLSVLD